MSWVSFAFERIKNSTEAIININRKTSSEKTFTVWIKEIRSHITNRTYKTSENKITFLTNVERKKIVVFPWFENQKIALKDDIIRINYQIIEDNKVEAELTVTTRIIVPKGFVPSVVYQEMQCLPIVDVDEEGWLKIEPKIEIKIYNLGDEEGEFNERLLELAIFAQNPSYMENLRSRIDCRINVRTTQQELPFCPAKDNKEERINFPIEIKIDRKCLTTLSTLSSIYLQINTYAKEDTRIIFELHTTQKLRDKIQNIISSTTVKIKQISPVRIEEEEIEVNINNILKNYLNTLKNQVKSFFDELEQLNEPLITSRTVRKYKGLKEEEKRQKISITEEDLWEKNKIEWESILLQEKNIIIQGPMGIGKTVLSYQIARKLLEDLKKENEKNKVIPLRIEGKELTIIEEKESFTFWDLITKMIGTMPSKNLTVKKEEENNVLHKTITKKLQEKGYNFLIILDGYDEIFSTKQGNNTFNVKSWIIRNCKNLDHNINLLVTGRPWSTNDFIPLVNDGIVELYKMEELSDEEVERYTIESLRALTKKEIHRETIEERLTIYKELYPNLYSRPLYLRILTLKSLEELNKPLDTFELLGDINTQTFCWTSVKFLTEISSTSEGKNLIRDYPNIQYLAKKNYLDFLKTVDDKPIIKTEEGDYLTYKALRLKIDELMEELANKIIIEPLKNGKTLNYLKLGEVETLLSAKRFKDIRRLFNRLVQDGNYWIIQRTYVISHVHIEVLFFNVYKILEYFTISYALKTIVVENDYKPLSVLLGNLSLIKGIAEMLLPIIDDDLSNETHVSIIKHAIDCSLTEEDLNTFKQLFYSVLNRIEIFKDCSTYHEAFIKAMNNWKNLNWFKKNNIGLLTKNFCISNLFIKRITCSIETKEEIVKLITKLTNLQELDLSYNSLEKLPESFSGLTNLQELDLSYNSLERLPELTTKLTNLQELDLSYNSLERLPESFGKLKNLKNLDLRSNSLERLPESFGKLKNLKKLDLYGNSLKRLPESFRELKNLQKLDLSGNSLKRLPEVVTKLTNLQRLDLSDNSLERLPKSFGKLKNLKKLYLFNNSLETLPENFGGLINLQELYLSDNSLERLPENFGKLKNLQELDLFNNSLKKLPENFGELKKLQKLDLKNNSLKRLPESFGKLTNLQKLYLFNNSLEKLPENFGELKKLQWLYLSYNSLETLPENFGGLINLQKLNLKNNSLKKLPENFGELKKLQWLYLSDNSLETLPENFGGLINLQKLNLKSNSLEKLPENFGELTNLQELDLKNNSLETLPENFGELTNLQELDLFNNSLKKLPENFGKLKNLKKLDLFNNSLERLPENFGELKKLQWLYLYGNSLKKLPENFGKLKKLQELNLSYNSLERLPENFGELKNLQKLDLKNNSLERLPENFGELTNLQKLDLSGNSLERLPENFGELTNLQKLDLSGNSLKRLPENFGELKNLQELDLKNNSLKKLPENFGKLKNLQKLDLSGNSLEKLPENFGELKNLQELDLSYNSLERLPENFGGLINLQKLDLKNNSLKKLPENFGKLKNLQKLDLSGNSLPALPSSITKLQKLRHIYVSKETLEGIDKRIITHLENIVCKIFLS